MNYILFDADSYNYRTKTKKKQIFFVFFKSFDHIGLSYGLISVYILMKI